MAEIKEIILNFALFISFSIAAFSIGDFIFHRFNFCRGKHIGIERFIFSIGLGFGIIGYLILAVGSAKLLFRFVAYLILFLLIIMRAVVIKNFNLNIKLLFKKYSTYFLNFNIVEKILFIFIIFVSFLNMIAAFAPATAQDALSSYLAIPKIFLREHRIFILNENFYSNVPILPSLLYLFGLMLNSEIIGQLIHWLFSVLASITIFCIGKNYSRFIGLLSAALFLCLQPVIWESSQALTDLPTTFFLLLGFYTFIKWLFLEEQKWIILSAVFAGLASSCKPLGPIYVGAFALVIFINMAIKQKLKAAMRIGIVYFFIFLAISGIWYIKAYIATGNPFFPAFFGGRGVSAEWLSNFLGSNYSNSPIRSIKRFFMFPIDLTYSHQIYGGWIGPLFLTFIPFIIIFREKADRVIINIFSYSLISYFFILILKIDFLVRWNLVLFAILSIPLSIVCYHLIYSHKERFIRLLTLIAIFTWLGFSLAYAAWKNTTCFPVVVGMETKDHYLQRMIPEDANFFEAFKYIDENLAKDVKILYVGSRGFYLDRDYIRFWRLSTGLLDTNQIKGAISFLNELKKLKITHVLIDYKIAEKHIARFNIEEGHRLFDYLKELISNQILSLVYQANSCTIYKI